MQQHGTEVCVVGSGVAGSIVAQECVDAGKEVLMVEAGNRVSGRAFVLRFIEQMMRDYRIPRMTLWHRQSRYRKTDFEWSGNRKFDLRGLLLVARGGSTLGWGGSAYRLQPEDFRRGSLTGEGIDWPLDYEELEPYYGLGEKTLCVSGDDRDGGHPPRNTPFPVPPVPFAGRDGPFLDLISAHGWAPMHNNISMAPDGGAFTGDLLLKQLEKRPNFHLLTKSAATRILCSSKHQARAVECWDVARGQSFTIEAETIVVCAGGIETPNILQQSANDWWPDGLGNHSRHLGRHLINHPGIALGGRPKGYRWINGPIEATAVTRAFDTVQEQSRGKYYLTWRPAPTGLLFLNTCVEQFPSETNRVTLGSGRTRFGTTRSAVCFDYSERDLEREQVIYQNLEILAKEMSLDVSHRRLYLHAHPMCTTRMSRSPEDGVLDVQLRVHTMNNVYVCSSAAFASAGAVNPTMTIAALAHRLGAHLTNSHRTAVGRTPMKEAVHA